MKVDVVLFFYDVILLVGSNSNIGVAQNAASSISLIL